MKEMHGSRRRTRSGLFFLLLLVVGPAVAWGAKTVGEDREYASAARECRAPDLSGARLVPPWEWTSAERSALRQRVLPDAPPPPASTSVAATTPAVSTSGATSGAPVTSAATDAPEGFDRAEYLLREGNALWCQNRFARARMNLVQARDLLEPMAAQKPVHPSVEKALRLCHDLIEDIDSR